MGQQKIDSDKDTEHVKDSSYNFLKFLIKYEYDIARWKNTFFDECILAALP